MSLVRRLLLFLSLSCISWRNQALNCNEFSRGPYLQSPTPTTMTIMWGTKYEKYTELLYTRSATTFRGAYIISDLVMEEGGTITGGVLSKTHTVTIKGLIPGTTYYYGAGGAEDSIDSILLCKFNFTTPPVPGTALATRIWAIGDSGTGTVFQEAVLQSFRDYAGSRPADLVLMLGDNAYGEGTVEQYEEKCFGVYRELMASVPFHLTFGNHEAYGSRPFAYYDLFAPPQLGQSGGVASHTKRWYSFDQGQAHIVCLESMEAAHDPALMAEQLQWVEADLQAVRTRPLGFTRWVIAFWHHPPYSKGSHSSDEELELVAMRERAVPRLEALGVDLVLSGHSHAYERSFLINGHHASSASFDPFTHKMGPQDVTSGSPWDGEVYHKRPYGSQYIHSEQGTVYVVCGGSGNVKIGDMDHPAMYTHSEQHGSLVIDYDSENLEVRYLTMSGHVADYFVICKAGFRDNCIPPTAPPPPPPPHAPPFSAPVPAPPSPHPPPRPPPPSPPPPSPPPPPPSPQPPVPPSDPPPPSPPPPPPTPSPPPVPAPPPPPGPGTAVAGHSEGSAEPVASEAAAAPTLTKAPVLLPSQRTSVEDPPRVAFWNSPLFVVLLITCTATFTVLCVMSFARALSVPAPPAGPCPPPEPHVPAPQLQCVLSSTPPFTPSLKDFQSDVTLASVVTGLEAAGERAGSGRPQILNIEGDIDINIEGDPPPDDPAPAEGSEGTEPAEGFGHVTVLDACEDDPREGESGAVESISLSVESGIRVGGLGRARLAVRDRIESIREERSSSEEGREGAREAAGRARDEAWAGEGGAAVGGGDGPPLVDGGAGDGVDDADRAALALLGGFTPRPPDGTAPSLSPPAPGGQPLSHFGVRSPRSPRAPSAVSSSVETIPGAIYDDDLV